MLRNRSSGPAGPRRFPTTRWSLVRRAGARDPAARQALEELCRRYWYPLYAFVRRTTSADPAQDVVQGFFASFLERGSLATVSEDGRRFRSYLLGALTHYQANEAARARAHKRGGGVEIVSLDEILDAAERRYRREPASPTTPEHFFEVRWVYELLDRVLAQLKREYESKGKSGRYHVLKEFLPFGGEPPYADVALELKTNVNNVKQIVHRLRLRFTHILLAEIADTVESPQEVREELRYLLTVLDRRP